MSNIERYSQETFGEIRNVTEDGSEFWYARQLQVVLGYAEWRNFSKVIDKAKIACKHSKHKVSSHFVDVNKIVDLGADMQRSIQDIMLSRYASYLIVQNADPRKEIVALGQTYFAVKTREREIEELTEEQKRLAIRNELTNHNKSLAEAAQMAGINKGIEYAVFQNKGYEGLYGGLRAKDIHQRKELKKSQQILDHMGSTELAANLFRATQTDDKLRRENIKGKDKANQTHYEVGSKVRQTIEELGGTMPEDLPTPPKSVKQIQKEHKKKELPID